MLTKAHLPWKLQEAFRQARNVKAYASRITAGALAQNRIVPESRKICITCGYHGLSGGAIAMANTASLLARDNQVHFLTHPNSNLNPLLGAGIRVGREIQLGADIYIADVSFDTTKLESPRASGARLIVCCHGLPDKLHGLSAARVRASLDAADLVVFVSAFQARAFNLASDRFAVIPNATSRIEKRSETNSIGTVGRLDEPGKGAAKTVRVGLQSKAHRIHLWGMTRQVHLDERVVIHSWESDKQRIYQSFDVLVFLSDSETFGMVVIEAMSAGIPCVLSNLEAYQEFRSCPGIMLVEDEKLEQAHNIVNDMLRRRRELKASMISHWQKFYSPEAVSGKWAELFNQLHQKIA